MLWVGTRGQMEETLAPQAGLKLVTIPAGPIAGVPLWQKVVHSGRLAAGWVSAMRWMARFQPDVLLLTGGYVNVPVALAARARRVPAMIYLPDIEPGAAIKNLSRLVERVACTAADSLSYFRPGQAVVTGYPVRAELRQAARLSREEACAVFNLDPSQPTLFVFGGSRGAQSINRALMGILPQVLTEAQVIHISGMLTWPEVEANAATLPVTARQRYRPYAYLHAEMGAAFRAAHLVVARAGASMLGECPAFSLPSILVPYPHAWRYQKVNADYLAARGAAVRLDDERLVTELWPTIQRLLHDPAQLGTMAAAAQALDRPGAARRLAEWLMFLGCHPGASEPQG